jgi:hypothetical protein
MERKGWLVMIKVGEQATSSFVKDINASKAEQLLKEDRRL